VYKNKTQESQTPWGVGEILTVGWQVLGKLGPKRNFVKNNPRSEREGDCNRKAKSDGFSLVDGK